MHSVGSILHIPEFAAIGGGSPRFVVEGVFEGGMGACLKIRSQQGGTTFALKGMRSELAQDDLVIRRFEQEVALWAALSGLRGVVPALGFVRMNGQPFVLAEWMPGGSIEIIMRSSRSRFFFQDRRRRAFYEATLSLLATLEQVWVRYGVVHRDIKPSNILLDQRGHARLADWGIAGGRDAVRAGGASPADPRLTSPGFMGTVLYASPEQIRNAAAVDWRSDLYSLACVLYDWEMGYPPFVGSSPGEIALQHLAARPQRLPGKNGLGEMGAGEFIIRCLEKSPDARYASHRQAIQALLKAARAAGIELSEPPVVMPPSRPRASQSGYGVVEREDLDTDLQVASALMSLGRHREAVPLLEQAFIPDVFGTPLDVGRLYSSSAINLALCYAHIEGGQDRGFAILEAVGNSGFRPAEWYLNTSSLHMRALRWERALTTAQEGLARYPEDIHLLGNVMQSLVALGKAAEAAGYIPRRTALGVDDHVAKDCSSVLLGAGRQVVEDWPNATKHFRQALVLLNEGLRVAPRVPVLYLKRAEVLLELYLANDALLDLRAFLDLARNRQDRAFAVGLMAKAMVPLGSDEPTLRWIDSALSALQPGDIDTELKRARAMLLAHQLRLENSGQRVRTTVGLDVNPSEILQTFWGLSQSSSAIGEDYSYYGYVAHWAGALDHALEVLAAGLSRFPEAYRIHLEIARIKVSMKRFSEAADSARRASTLAPHRPEPLDLLAPILAELGDPTAHSVKAQADTLYERRLALAHDGVVVFRPENGSRN